jgi:hypothetical protein
VPSKGLTKCQRIIAPIGYQPAYEAHEGVNTGGLNGAYFVEAKERYPDGTVLVQNLWDVGKIKCAKVQLPVEGDLLFPLARGRSVGRWHVEANCHILMVQDPKTQKGHPEEWLQKTHPLTWAYLRKFEKQLRARKAFQKFFDPKRDPFYSMYSVGEYTLARHKVVWMDISLTMKAAVMSAEGKAPIVLPEHTVMFISTDSAQEAHYLAAVLNSAPVNAVVSGYIVDNHISTHPIENIVIPRFRADDTVHVSLAKISREAHRTAVKGDAASAEIAKQLDETVERLWEPQ